MDPMVSVRNVMNHEYVGVSEGDPLRGVAELLTEANDTTAVVQRGSEPVGIITGTDIVSVLADGRDITGLLAKHVMSEFATVHVDQSLGSVVEQLREHPVLLVLDDTAVVGTIAHSNLVPIASLLGNSPKQEQSMVAEEATDFEPQGICERCGSLTATLRELHGQIVCPDCLTT